MPVVAVRAGGPADLIAERRSGLLCEPDAGEIAAKLLRLLDDPALHRRLAQGGLAAARERSWAFALEQLAEGYSLTLSRRESARSGSGRDAAAGLAAGALEPA